MTRTAWVVENGKSGEDLRYRCWVNGSPSWHPDIDSAVQYARRIDAEVVHEEDEDAWLIVEHGFET